MNQALIFLRLFHGHGGSRLRAGLSVTETRAITFLFEKGTATQSDHDDQQWNKAEVTRSMSHLKGFLAKLLQLYETNSE